jgi:hypothetical protein
MRNEFFSGLVQEQAPGHCGACSLSACMWLLGFDATQRQVARAAGRPWSVYAHGLDETRLRRAASRLGVACAFLSETKKSRGRAFVAALTRHLEQGLPAVLITSDFGHWVAVVGFLRDQRQYVVMDPNDPDHAFSFWSERTLRFRAWNESEDEARVPSEFFALLVSRKDGRPARWRITRDFLRLSARGSVETAEQMASDLQEMVHRAASEPSVTRGGEPLARALERQEQLILDSVRHWAAHEREGASPREVAGLFHDYRTVAEAAGLELPSRVNEAAMVAQMTVLVTTYAWKGEL